jgi:CRISPR/Cas system-associated exonuclease Cas4 (RecB family)
MAYSYYNRPYQPGQRDPYKLSRSKIDLFIQCPRCFYLDTRLGIKRVSMPPFTLNSAVDQLLKNEFDVFRQKGEPHPMQTQFGVEAVPAQHEQLNIWRENFKGIECIYKPANLKVTGAIDDLWVSPQNEYIVVDYKATSKASKVDRLEDTRWHDAYRRQMEVYQWLLRRNGLTVSDTGYFVYCNGIKDANIFDNKLDFEVIVFPYTGKDDWVEPTLTKIKEILEGEIMPDPAEDCEHCAYARQRTELTLEALRRRQKDNT